MRKEKSFATSVASKKRQPCEIYSRVVGYLRPVSSWNDAMEAQYWDRKVFKEKGVAKKTTPE